VPRCTAFSCCRNAHSCRRRWWWMCKSSC
jgi:hypothetical protein